ncbi:hypothetical protein D3C74_394630 [compost metagenome]
MLCVILLLSRMFRAASLPSFLKIWPYTCSSPIEARFVIGGIISIVAAINPNKENPPARYNIFPETTFGRNTEIRSKTNPIPTIKRRGMRFSSTVPRTTSLIGRLLACCTGSHALSRETAIATVKEIMILDGEITTGISIPCDRDCPIPCKINFNTSIPTGIPINPPMKP